MSILTAKNLCVEYNKVLALSDLTLNIEKGEYVCLLGNNGSGKSTFLKTSVGLIKPASGEVKINLPEHKISYLPQQNMAEKDFPATVSEIVLTGTQKTGEFRPFYTKKDRKDAE